MSKLWVARACSDEIQGRTLHNGAGLQSHFLFCTNAWHQVLATAEFDLVRTVRGLAAWASLKGSLKM